MSAPGGGYKMESREARALASITTESYDYRDQAKLLTKLTGDVSYLAQYTRQMQKGIDSANQNFIQQFQDFINEILVVISGGGNTGFEWGDLGYILQAIGSLFGFDTEEGIGAIFPVNLFQAAWHFISNYLFAGQDFWTWLNESLDTFFATILELFGQIPVVGQALQQVITILVAIKDAAGKFVEFFGTWTLQFVNGIVSVASGAWSFLTQLTEPILTGIINTVTFVVETFAGWSKPFVDGLIFVVNWLAGLFEGFTRPIIDTLVSIIDWLAGIFEGWSATLTTFIVDTINWLWTTFFGWTEPIATGIINTVAFLVTLFGEWTAELVTFIVDTVNWIWTTFFGWTEPIATGIINTVAFLLDLFGDWTLTFVNFLVDTIDWLWTTFIAWTEPIATFVIDTVNWLWGLFSAWTAPFVTLVNQVVAVVQDIVDWFVGGVGSAINMLFPWAKKLPQMQIVNGAEVLKTANVPQIETTKLTGTVAPDQIASLPTSKIGSGEFPSERIANFAISGDKLSSGAVTAPKIFDGAVQSTKLADLAVNSDKLANNAVTAPKIPDFTVGNSKVNNDIDASKIFTGQFPSARILDGAITTDKILDNAINTLKLGPTAVTNAKVNADIDASKIFSGQFPTARILDNAITGAKILNGEIVSNKLADSAVTNAKVNADIDASKIFSGQFPSSRLLNGAVTTTKIATGAVTSNEIGTDAVTTTKIATGAVTSNEIGADAVTTTKIATGAVTSDELGAASVIAGKLGSLAVANANIQDAAVTGAKTSTLDATKLTSGKVPTTVLPNGIGAVGSGVALARTTLTGSFTTLRGSNFIPANFYDTASATPDITINNTTCTRLQALNAGWYLVEVGFTTVESGINYSWCLAPIIYKLAAGVTAAPLAGEIPWKYGSSSLYYYNSTVLTQTFGGRFSQSSFIVYLNANESIVPGYHWSNYTNSVASGTIITSSPSGGSTTNGLGTYCSMSLINRSLN